MKKYKLIVNNDVKKDHKFFNYLTEEQLIFKCAEYLYLNYKDKQEYCFIILEDDYLIYNTIDKNINGIAYDGFYKAGYDDTNKDIETSHFTEIVIKNKIGKEYEEIKASFEEIMLNIYYIVDKYKAQNKSVELEKNRVLHNFNNWSNDSWTEFIDSLPRELHTKRVKYKKK